MRHELSYGIPFVVLLALVAVIAADYCRPLPIPDKITSFSVPSPFNPFCYVASFRPEAPELQTTTTSTSLSISSSAVVGTATTTTTTL